MALKAVVYPQTQDSSFGFGIKDLCSYNWAFEDQASINFLDNQTDNSNNYPYGDWNNNFAEQQQQHHFSDNNNNNNNNNPLLSVESNDLSNNQNLDHSSNSTTTESRPKRRRAKIKKNKEQIENQRMTHIAVERNRRKQMNEYLSVLRSLMPDFYVQRGDQASIIGGAINFVKELEQRMQFLGSHNQKKKSDVGGSRVPFCEFFTFPQYSSTTSATNTCCDNSSSMAIGGEHVMGSSSSSSGHEFHSAVGIADIEVTMVESHANLKIRSKKRPKQLLKIVSGLHNMCLTILHLNLTTTTEIVLYSLSVKVEDDCKLGSVDDIAAAVYQLMVRIQQEAIMC